MDKTKCLIQTLQQEMKKGAQFGKKYFHVVQIHDKFYVHNKSLMIINMAIQKSLSI